MAFLLAMLACLLAAPPAAAERGLLTGFSEGLYASPSEAERDLAYDSTLAANAGIVRINVTWRTIARAQPLDPRNPADPAYDFGLIDTAVADAVERGLEVMITVYSAPDYAESPGRPEDAPLGTWKPDPGAFGDFATAIASRYSGGFGGLPRVRYFQAWNEPNLSTYLTPQYDDGHRPQSPTHYRLMLNSFYAAVKAVNPNNQVITAGTAPYGDPPGGNRLRPLAFWRDVLCLTGGKKPKPTDCPTKASFDILAHHPINTSGGPRTSAIDPDDVSTPDLKNLGKVLRAAEKSGTTATGGGHPLWATELWWDSNPPDSVEGVPVQKQARYLEEALYVLWKQGASVVINLQLRDSPFDPGNAAADNSTGVLFSDGSSKPSFKAFRFPFVTERRTKRRVVAWGRAPAGGKLVIERRTAHGWKALDSLNVAPGDVFKTGLRLRGRAAVRAQVNGETSLVWRQRR